MTSYQLKVQSRAASKPTVLADCKPLFFVGVAFCGAFCGEFGTTDNTRPITGCDFRGKRMKDGMRKSSLNRGWLILCFAGFFCGSLAGQDNLSSQRLTPLVKVIQDIEPAVVALFTPVQNQIVSGSGTIIHEDGYILTNNHVLPESEGFALLPNSKPMRFRVIGRVPESDIAVIRLIDATVPLKAVPIGHSADLMNGESVVVAGNPGGRGTVYTSGIVSSKAVLEGGPNALVMTNYQNSRRDMFIQFDAASNRGNSGGPLVNMDGKIIGIVSAVVNGEQNVGLAIPVDRVRRQFEQMLEPELIHQRSTGLRIDPLTNSAVIVSVSESSAAAESGLRTGDVIEAVNGSAVRHVVDWLLMLETLLPQDKPLQLSVIRGSETLSVDLTPQVTSALPSIAITTPVPGLKYSLHYGNFTEMPDFTKLPVERNGTVEALGPKLKDIYQTRQDYFGINLEGLLKIDEDGLYRLVIVSDDGSRVFLNGNLLIDHDGNHPPKPSGPAL